MAGNLYNGLPRFCYAPDPYNGGKPALIYPGDSVYYGAERQFKQAASQMDVGALNALAGVTPAQAQAMRAGIERGWGDPRANPEAYNTTGQYRG